mmetsp:Transcript_101493/g.206052  ORF Transcript_101493/g.206052 Transcript_101493/m.206052 type:complete len:85 (+) Transcript_101493:2012-2266(+)
MLDLFSTSVCCGNPRGEELFSCLNGSNSIVFLMCRFSLSWIETLLNQKERKKCSSVEGHTSQGWPHVTSQFWISAGSIAGKKCF